MSRPLRILAALCFVMILASCGHSNILMLKYHPNYTFKNRVNDKPVILTQEVIYNPPLVIDAYFQYILSLDFGDSIPKKKVIDLPADDSIVKAGISRSSVWSWDDPKRSLSGRIRIVRWDKDRILLREHLTVSYAKRNFGKYVRGRVVFKRKS